MPHPEQGPNIDFFRLFPTCPLRVTRHALSPRVAPSVGAPSQAYSGFLTTIVLFCPPKPKLLERQISRSAFLASLGT